MTSLRPGQRAGVPWLGHVCGHCSYCNAGRENLCDEPRFTGYTRDGDFATHVVAEAAFCFVEARFYPLSQANEALDDLRSGRIVGAAVLVP